MGLDLAGIGAQAEGAALIHIVALAGHEIDDLMGALLVELAGIGVGDAGNVAGVFDHGDLHAEADAEIGQPVFPGIAGGEDHPVDPSPAEAAGDQDPVYAAEHLTDVFGLERFGIDPPDIHPGAQLIAGMMQCLGHREIGVVELHILPDQRDAHLPVGSLDALDHTLPLRQLGSGGVDAQLAADDRGEVGVFKHQRGFVEAGQRAVFDHAVGLDVAEQGDLFEDPFFERTVAAQHDNIRMDTHALQLLYGMLGGLGFMLVRAAEEGHERDVDEEAVFAADLQRDLAHGLDEGLGFDVADGAADFGDDHVGIGLHTHAIDKILNLVGDMRDDLHRGAEVFAAALLIEHIPVDLSGRQVGIAVEVLVNEALVMAEVEVGFGAVFGHIHLAVLIRAHGAGVDIDIGIELLGGHLQSPCFEQPAQGCRRDPLSEAGNHAAGHKNIFCHLCHLFIDKSIECFPRSPGGTRTDPWPAFQWCGGPAPPSFSADRSTPI